MEFLAFTAFIRNRAKELRTIAGQTNGDLTVGDLESEAWLIANHQSGKEGVPIDWNDPQDQKLIIHTLKKNHVWKTKRDRRRTISADKEVQDQDGGSCTLLDLLSADELADPLAVLEHREEQEVAKARQDEEDAILESYSQSVAYNILLWSFDNIRIRAADFLAIHRGTLRKRIVAAAEILRMQPSLFDRIEQLAESFRPRQGVRLQHPARPGSHNSANQWTWEF